MRMVMSQRFDFAKWFGRAIAFVIILAPMIISQFTMDRGAIEHAVKNNDFADCYQTKRAYYFEQCRDKIILKKTEYCEATQGESCYESFVLPIEQAPQRGSPFFLIPIEILFCFVLTIWAMGLTPAKVENLMPNTLANISTSESYALYRIPMALVMFLGCYYLFQLVHGLYS